MKAFTWNYRGLGHPSNNNALRDFFKQEEPDIVLLQETKQGEKYMGNIINKIKNYTGTMVELRGASGGIATIWNQNSWKQLTIVKAHDCIKFKL